jgi:hypothetical protein
MTKKQKKQKNETKLMQDTHKFLSRVPEEQVFWCHDGRIFRNMEEFGEALATMSDETFAYHLNAEKKDFSNWVRDVIGDTKLANDLENVLDRSQAAGIVASRIAYLRRGLRFSPSGFCL